MPQTIDTIALIWVVLVIAYGTIALALLAVIWMVRQLRTGQRVRKQDRPLGTLLRRRTCRDETRNCQATVARHLTAESLFQSPGILHFLARAVASMTWSSSRAAT
jgi:hypothetical protein